MDIIQTDVAIVGAGGAGLRAAIEIARAAPDKTVHLISKVYPMRSHTVAAEGGSAGVVRDDDSLENHFNDTVSGGDWLCEQDVVQYFVEHATEEMIQMEHWGCPWSRLPDGRANVRRFGGMKIPRTWFAADKTGFHMLHTLFQTSMQYPNIKRLDEHFALDLLINNGELAGVLCYGLQEGVVRAVQAKSVIIATGGAGRVFAFNTNGGIVTGDGMAMAYRHGVPLRDMEFVQYHPTGLPGSGILMTEGCRGEGGILVNKDGYRYLQDYGLGPETPIGEPKNKYMELGPRDRLSQAFYHEWKAGRTISTPRGDAVHLDLRHLGEDFINERLPFIRSLAQKFVGVDPVHEPIPVRPTAHYTMGGIETNQRCETRIKGLFAVGECSSVGLHGANRLGSNSLAELCVFGKVAGEDALKHAQTAGSGLSREAFAALAEQAYQPFAELKNRTGGTEKPADIRRELGTMMEAEVGIYRSAENGARAKAAIRDLKARYQNVRVTDHSDTYNTDWLTTIELGYLLDVAEAMIYSADARTESRGAHQRLDFPERDDENFLKHTLSFYRGGQEPPQIEYSSVLITKSQPAKRVYGAEGEKKS
ncbi:fumarate reductase (quinol) flavoprotein subunit [Neisseria dentiae]|uniref:Fumarate reductase flavoprotein subunit n=1 Tax=Neisseria dentiae TaxID=194197 RepID=A0A1X3D3M9_9NEIS|nr:fumarate reductase (quinol) flavoprotein subunit [Neisseria dentiae]OSI14396.1 fumarate reductase (quinol) flavoprotein subunit [Neisseria dentiae]QMT46041.1 fumarate reductase (quinol) flavoprotein subunit [Neisseria dentiae]STZ52091.1 succinate dehydrogenase flavoprotein subunit [Neisseria dentiae]